MSLFDDRLISSTGLELARFHDEPATGDLLPAFDTYRHDDEDIELLVNWCWN